MYPTVAPFYSPSIAEATWYDYFCHAYDSYCLHRDGPAPEAPQPPTTIVLDDDVDRLDDDWNLLDLEYNGADAEAKGTLIREIR